MQEGLRGGNILKVELEVFFRNYVFEQAHCLYLDCMLGRGSLGV